MLYERKNQAHDMILAGAVRSSQVAQDLPANHADPFKLVRSLMLGW